MSYIVSLLRDGNMITIDAVNNSLEFAFSENEIAIREKIQEKLLYKVSFGILKKNIRLASAASEDCTSD